MHSVKKKKKKSKVIQPITSQSASILWSTPNITTSHVSNTYSYMTAFNPFETHDHVTKISFLLAKLPLKFRILFTLDCLIDACVEIRRKKVDLSLVDKCIDAAEGYLEGRTTIQDCSAISDKTFKEATLMGPPKKYESYLLFAASDICYVIAMTNQKGVYPDTYTGAYSIVNSSKVHRESKKDKLKEYYLNLVKSIKEMPELDRIIYDIDLRDI